MRFKVCPDCATPGCLPQPLCIFPHPTSSTIPVCGSPCPASQAPSEPPALIQRPQQSSLCRAADLTLSSQAPANPHELGVTRSASPHRIPPQRQHTGMATAIYRCSQGHSAFIPFNTNSNPEVPLRGQSISELTHSSVCVIYFSTGNERQEVSLTWLMPSLQHKPCWNWDLRAVSAASNKERLLDQQRSRALHPWAWVQPTATKGDQTSPPSCLLELLLPTALLLVRKLRHGQREQFKLIHRAQLNRDNGSMCV